VDGFVLTGGNSKYGGAIALRNGAAPLLKNLVVHSNSGTYGGAVFCHSASPVMRNMLIANNEAEGGGAIYCITGASPFISKTTLVHNTAKFGAAIAALDGSAPTVDRCLVANHSGGIAFHTQDEGSKIVISCSDLWANGPQDLDAESGQTMKLRDNISEDPLFLAPEEMDFTPALRSPVLSLERCGRIGALHSRIHPEFFHSESLHEHHEH
jgi:predicted outer membrane repeat protein